MRNAFMFVVNKKMKFALISMLINLRAVMKNTDYYVEVIYDDLSDDDITEIEKQFHRITFTKYTLQDFIEEHKDFSSKKAIEFFDRYTHLTLCKYKVFDLAGKYDALLLLDLDMLLLDDIGDIFKIKGIAWKSGVGFYDKFKSLGKSAKSSPYSELFKNIPQNASSPNGGLIYVSVDKDESSKCEKTCLDFIKRFGNDLIKGGFDEFIIAYSTHVSGVQLTELNKCVYNVLPRNYCSESKLMHFMGERKPWNDAIYQLVFKDWFINYRSYYSTDCEYVKSYDRGKTLSTLVNRDRWLNSLRKFNFSVPDNLKIKYDFDHPWLIMDYSKNVYYEIKFIVDFKGYYIGLWIRDNNLINDNEFLANIDMIIANNPDFFRKRTDERGLYIYSVKLSEEEAFNSFNYFYCKTVNVFDGRL